MPPKTPQERTNTRAMIVFIGAAVLFAVAWFFTLSYRLFLWDVPVEAIRRSGITRELRGGAGDMTTVLLMLLFVTACYAVCIWALTKPFRHGNWFAIGGVILVGASALPAMPLTSPDTMHFAADVRTLWLHGRYPTQFDNAPEDVDDPIAKEVRVFANGPSGYGPVTYVVGGLALPFVGDNLRANIFGIKMVSFLGLIVTAVMCGLIARSLGRNPAVIIAAIGMNPTFVWHFPGDGHNDTIMSAFGMAGVLFLIRSEWSRRGIGAGLSALSVFSKFSVALVAPVVLTAWFPRFRLFIGGGVALVGVTLVALYFGMNGEVAGTSGPFEGVTRNTPWYFLFESYGLEGNARQIGLAVCYAGAILLVAAVCLGHPFETKQDMVNAMGLTMGLFLFLFTPTLRQWYQLWAFPLLALCSIRWLRMAGYTFSLAGMLTVLALNWNISMERQMGISNPIQTTVVIVWVLTSATGIFWWLKDRPSTRVPRTTRRTQPTRGRRKLARS